MRRRRQHLVAALVLAASVAPAFADETARLLERSRHYLGTEEVPENRGVTVDYFNRTAGADPGSPWCASSQFTICREAGLESFRQPPLPNAYVPSWDRAERRDPVPRVGDHGLVWFAGLGRYAHIGLVVAVATRGGRPVAVTMHEGNTNYSGEREGRFYMARTRTLDGLRFVRYVQP